MPTAQWTFQKGVLSRWACSILVSLESWRALLHLVAEVDMGESLSMRNIRYMVAGLKIEGAK